MIERMLRKEIEKYIKNKEIIAILGPRQVGKTTLLKQIYDGLNNAHFTTFEDVAVLELFETNINEFIEEHVKGYDYLFIDEVQYSKACGKKLKFIFDTEKIKIFITGSSALDISIQGIKFLVGRILIFNLLPCNFMEFLNYKDSRLASLSDSDSDVIIKRINKHYQNFSIYGGYPAVIIAKNIKEKQILLSNIFNTYLLKEIRDVMGISEDFIIMNLIKALALQVGKTVNKTELRNTLDVNNTVLDKYLNILDKTFICKKTHPFYRNKRTELKKSKKYFFYDNGFLNTALGNYGKAVGRYDSGAINENFIASELIKKEIDFNYWRTQTGAEVDFVIEKQREVIPIEVKSTLTRKKTTRSFLSFIDKYKCKHGYFLSYSLTGRKQFKGCTVHFYPLYKIGEVEFK